MSFFSYARTQNTDYDSYTDDEIASAVRGMKPEYEQYSVDQVRNALDGFSDGNAREFHESIQAGQRSVPSVEQPQPDIAPAPQPDIAPPPDEGVSPADYVYGAAVGAAQLPVALGWLIKKIPGLEAVGEPIEKVGQNAVDYWNKAISPAAKREMQKQFVRENEETGEWEWGDAGWHTAGLAAAGSLAGTAAGMGLGGLATKGILAAIPGRAALQTMTRGGGAAAIEAGKKLATQEMLGGAVGFGLGEGSIAGVQTAQQVESAITSMDPNKLVQVPAFQEAYHSKELESLSHEQRFNLAWQEMARMGSTEAGQKAGLTTALLGAPMGAVWGKGIFGRMNLGKTLPQSIGVGAIGEAAQEAPQSGLEQYYTNRAIQKYGDINLPTSQGVANAVVGGGIAGGLLGMGGGAASYSPQQPQPGPQPGPEIPGTYPDDAVTPPPATTGHQGPLPEVPVPPSMAGTPGRLDQPKSKAIPVSSEFTQPIDKAAPTPGIKNFKEYVESTGMTWKDAQGLSRTHRDAYAVLFDNFVAQKDDAGAVPQEVPWAATTIPPSYRDGEVTSPPLAPGFTEPPPDRSVVPDRRVPETTIPPSYRDGEVTSPPLAPGFTEPPPDRSVVPDRETKNAKQKPKTSKQVPPKEGGKGVRVGGQKEGRQGKIGEQLAHNEVRLTITGNETTPFPRVDTSSKRKAGNTHRRVDKWLIENATEEARANGDEFNLLQFEDIDLSNISQADRDAAETYLFDESPVTTGKIPKPISRDLVGKPEKVVARKIDGAFRLVTTDGNVDQYPGQTWDSQPKALRFLKDNQNNAKSGKAATKTAKKEAATTTPAITTEVQQHGDEQKQPPEGSGGKEAEEAKAEEAKATPSTKKQPPYVINPAEDTGDFTPTHVLQDGRQVRIIDNPHLHGHVSFQLIDNGELVDHDIEDSDQLGNAVLLDTEYRRRLEAGGQETLTLIPKPEATDNDIPTTQTTAQNDQGKSEVQRPETVSPTDAGQETKPVGGKAGAGGRGGIRGDGGADADNRQGDEAADRGTKEGGHGTSETGKAPGGKKIGAKPGDRAGTTRPRAKGITYSAPEGGLTRTGSWRDTAARNVDIIELVKTIEKESRLASPKEQEQIAQYTGFGAGEIANKLFPIHFIYGKRGQRIPTGRVAEYSIDKSWRPIYDKLKALLSEEEMSTMLRSTQYAHYTSEPVIRSIWKSLETMGFHGGNILEPGMGTGLFMVAAPKDIVAASKYVGVEMDRMTASIASQLLQTNTVLNKSFIDQMLPDNMFDVAIGNPPFGKTPVLADSRYAKLRLPLHDYFFAKTIDKVRPGGLLVFVSSRYTMDKVDSKARDYIADRADLVGAIRLPQTAFKQSAGTEVVTDILFLKKRFPGEAQGGEDWAELKEITVAEGEKVSVNEYFASHPAMVLGRHSTKGTMYAANQYTVIPAEGSIEEQFAEAAERLPADVYSEHVRPDSEAINAEAVEREFNVGDKKEGGLYLSDAGEVMRVEYGSGVPISSVMKVSPKETAWLKDYVGLRDSLRQAHKDQLEDGDWEKSQAELVGVYQSFRKKHGRLQEHTITERKEKNAAGDDTTRITRRFKWRRLIKSIVDADMPNVLQVETFSDDTVDNTIHDGDILRKRVLNKPKVQEIHSAPDALAVSLAENGRLNIKDISDRLSQSEDKTIEQLGDLIYNEPGRGLILADEYLSGDVVRKLEEAQTAEKLDPAFHRNVEALLKVQPLPRTQSQITIKLGANWINPAYVQRFTKDVLEDESKITYKPASNNWVVSGAKGRGSRSGRTAANDWGSSYRTTAEILDSVLNNQEITIREKDSDGKTYVVATETALVREIADNMRREFASWVWRDPRRAKYLLATYNMKFNNIADRVFDGSHLNPPGLSLSFELYPSQKRTIWRIIQTGDTYVAHAVGGGKTLISIVSAMEQKRLGLIRKPMFVVPNHMLEQFSNEFAQAYPAAKILVADKDQFTGDNRRRFISNAALNDWDAVIIKQSAFALLGVNENTKKLVAADLLDELEAAILETEEGDRFTRKKLEAQKERLEQMIGKNDSGKKDTNLKFEDMGIDFLYIDEAHAYRKLDFATNMKAKGIAALGSKAAFDMFVKVRGLESKRPGRSVVFMSGTPITNTLAELYTVQRFMNYEGLRRDGLHAFDAWANTYGSLVTEWERNAAGGYEPITRFGKFVNVPEMMNRVRQFMDVITMSQLGELVDRPSMNTGKPQMITSMQSDALKEYMEGELSTRLEASKAWKPSPGQMNNPDPVINIITDGKLSAIDARFFDHTLNDDPGSKLNTMVDKIAVVYQNTKGRSYTTTSRDGAVTDDKTKGGAQIVFAPVGFGEAVAKRRGFNAKQWVVKRLAKAGIPSSEIAFMGDYKTDAKKEAMFRDLRSGKKRILIGSPMNMGTGLNIQKRLVALHYLTPPWYPADIEQPHGRILRTGNQNMDGVDIFWYVTEGTYDSTMWGMVRRKGTAIEQAFQGDQSVTSVEDVSEISSYAMAEAVASGDSRVVKLASLKSEAAKLEQLKQAHWNAQSALRGEKAEAEFSLKSASDALERMKVIVKQNGTGWRYKEDYEVTVMGKVHDTPTETGKAIIREAKKRLLHGPDSDYIGDINNKSKIYIERDPGSETPYSPPDVTIFVEYNEDIKKSIYFRYELGPLNEINPVDVWTKIRSAMYEPEKRIHVHEEEKTTLTRKLRTIKSKYGAPYEREAELAERIAEAATLEAELVGEGAEEESKHSRPRPTSGASTVAQVQGIYRGIMGKASIKAMDDGGWLHIVQSQADVPDEVRRGHTIAGAYDPDTGNVWVVADAVQSEAHAIGLLLHELGTHAGLKPMLGPDLYHQVEQQMRQMRDRGQPQVVAAYAAVPKDTAENNIDEEAIGYFVEDSTARKLPLWRRITNAIKTWLVSKGYLKKHVVDNLTADDLVVLAKAAVMSGAGRAAGAVPAYSYLGEAAKTADKSALDIARLMERGGASKSKIRTDTGWFRGDYDNKWRFEISDADVSISDSNGKNQLLGDLMRHDALFDAYPELRKIKVERIKRGGFYNLDTNTIGISGSAVRVKETLVHEMQHAVQAIEGFARGGTSIPRATAAEESKMDSLSEEHQKAISRGDEATAQLVFDENAVIYRKIAARARVDYNRLAGEIEARDVAARMWLTPNGRLMQAPYATQGVAPKDAIVRFRGSQSLLSEQRTTVTFSPISEPRFQEAKKGLGDQRSMWQRIKDHAGHTYNGFTRHHIALAKIPENALAYEALRQLEAAPGASKQIGISELQRIVDVNMSPEDFDLFSRKVIVDDQLFEAHQKHKLAFGWTEDTLRVDKAAVDAAVAANPDVARRIQMRKELMDRMLADLQEAGIIGELEAQNPAYLHHQVLTYARARQYTAGASDVQTPSPGLAKHRAGSEEDINANYLEYEFEYLQTAMVAIKMKQTLNKLDIDYNVMAEAKDRARSKNNRRLEDIYEAERTMEPDGKGNQIEIPGPTEAVSKAFGRNMAIAADKLSSRAASGNLEYVPAEYSDTLDQLTENAFADEESGMMRERSEQFFPLLSWLANNGEEADRISALMFIKAANGKTAHVMEALGEDYIDTRITSMDKAKALIASGAAPEGVVPWQPSPGSLWYKGGSLSDELLANLNDMAEAALLPGGADTSGLPAGLDAQALKTALEQVRTVTIRGGAKQIWLIPEELAETLDNMRPDQSTGFFDHVLATPLTKWKQWVLINPRRFFKYNLNNTSGDADAAFAAAPGIFKHLPQAIRELWHMMRPHGTVLTQKFRKMQGKEQITYPEPSADALDAIRGGVMEAGFTVQEIPDIGLMDPFQHLIESPRFLTAPWKSTKSALTSIWNVLRDYTRFRENWLRYAAYLYYKEQVDKGRAPSEIGYGASNPAMADEIFSDSKMDFAMMMSRNAVGDYGDVAEFGLGIRKYGIPFYSWMDVNTKRYVQLFSNAFHAGDLTYGQRAGLASRAGASLVLKGAMVSAHLYVRIFMVYMLVQLYNNLFHRDEEEALGTSDRIRLHLNLGQDENGVIRQLRIQGALSDFLQWFGLGDAVAAILNIESGRADLSDVLKAVAKGAPNKIISGLSPVIKAPAELLGGVTVFPDAFNPRPIRDKARYVARMFSVENELDVLTGKPSRGYGRSWEEALIYKKDAGEMTYNKMRSLVFNYHRRMTGEEGQGYRPTPKSESVRLYRMALKYRDHKAARKYLKQYAELGGTQKSLRSSIKRAHPLAGIAMKNRARFVGTLSPRERQALKQAVAWYRETYL